MKKPKWLDWQSSKTSRVSKAESLRKVRQMTDQKIKQQEVQKELQDEAEEKFVLTNTAEIARVVERRQSAA